MNSYTKTNWVNGGEPAITAENLNNIENGIEAATEGVTAVEQGKADKSDTYIKGEVNMMLSNKADKTSVYTKTAVDTNFVNINDYQDNIDSIDLQLGTIEQSLSNKADKSTTDAIELSLQHKENDTNKVVTVSEESTDTEYPSAKCLYNALQGCMRYENIDTSVSTSGLDNLTESNTIYDFLYNDIHEKVILLFIDSGERAESEGRELFVNCAQIMFTESGRILKRQSDDEGTWGSVTDVLALKEDSINKISIIDPNTATNTQYPSARAVVNYINTILGKGASESD